MQCRVKKAGEKVKQIWHKLSGIALGGIALIAFASAAMADRVVTDDLIVVGNACVGMDCVNNRVFETGPLTLDENNTRVAFGRNNGFRLAANDNAAGGLNEFRIDSFQGPLSFEDVSGTLNIPFAFPLSSAVVRADGSLEVPIEDLRTFISVDRPSGPVDGTVMIDSGQTVVIPAGAWSEQSSNVYTFTPGTVVGSTLSTGFDVSITGAATRFVAFSDDGNMVTLGAGSVYEAGAVSVGNATTQRQVQGVADAVADGDLINLGQLEGALGAAPLVDLSSSIRSELSRLEGVSAMTAAMSALQANPRAQAPVSLSLGLGTYEGETAAAVGLLFRMSDNAHVQFGLAGSNETSPQSSLSLKIAW